MSTMTDQKVDVNVNVMEKSITYISNSLFQLFLRITNGRNLPPDYITSNRDILEKGFFTWCSEQSLKSVHLEIISPDSARAVERWDIALSYSSDPDSEVKKTPVSQIADVCKKLKGLPRGSQYRILVQTEPWASRVNGWSETSFKPFKEKSMKNFSGFGYGHIHGKLYYREGSWNSEEKYIE